MPYASVTATFYCKGIKNREVRGMTQEGWNFNKKGGAEPYQVMLAIVERYLEFCHWLTDEEIAAQLEKFKGCVATLKMDVIKPEGDKPNKESTHLMVQP